MLVWWQAMGRPPIQKWWKRLMWLKTSILGSTLLMIANPNSRIWCRHPTATDRTSIRRQWSPSPSIQEVTIDGQQPTIIIVNHQHRRCNNQTVLQLPLWWANPSSPPPRQPTLLATTILRPTIIACHTVISSSWTKPKSQKWLRLKITASGQRMLCAMRSMVVAPKNVVYQKMVFWDDDQPPWIISDSESHLSAHLHGA